MIAAILQISNLEFAPAGLPCGKYNLLIAYIRPVCFFCMAECMKGMCSPAIYCFLFCEYLGGRNQINSCFFVARIDVWIRRFLLEFWSVDFCEISCTPQFYPHRYLWVCGGGGGEAVTVATRRLG